MRSCFIYYILYIFNYFIIGKSVDDDWGWGGGGGGCLLPMSTGVTGRLLADEAGD